MLKPRSEAWDWKKPSLLAIEGERIGMRYQYSRGDFQFISGAMERRPEVVPEESEGAFTREISDEAK